MGYRDSIPPLARTLADKSTWATIAAVIAVAVSLKGAFFQDETPVRDLRTKDNSLEDTVKQLRKDLEEQKAKTAALELLLEEESFWLVGLQARCDEPKPERRDDRAKDARAAFETRVSRYGRLQAVQRSQQEAR